LNIFFKGTFSLVILSIAVVLSIGNKKQSETSFNHQIATVSQVIDDSYFIPGYGKSYIGFKENLAFKESQGKYHVINELGYMGKYQFGASTLATLKVKDSAQFMNSPKIQESVFLASLARNKWFLQKEIDLFSGKTINGVEITESGILAAAHLAGVGSVKKFLYSNGKKRAKDAFGTRIEYYMRDFAHYDLSHILAEQNPSH
jgi:hypothetical protein